MLQRLLQLVILSGLACFMMKPASAAPYEVTNVTVSVQAKDAVQARDQAIVKAQRIAFAAITGQEEATLSRITDSQIARLVRGFSLQSQRQAARSFAGIFTVRFNPAATQNFIHMNGLALSPVAASGETIVVNKVVTASTTAEPAKEGEQPVAATPVAQGIIVLPVLDIGSRRVIWDEPNPWRDVWQKADQSKPNLQVRVPLGDVDDISDVPDAGFLSEGAAKVDHMLERYGASDLYVIVAKNLGASLNTAGGMSLSLYRHNGKKLQFIKKTTLTPRPGYLFDDAVPAAMQMIEATHTGKATPSTDSVTTDASVYDAPVSGSIAGPLVVTVPYQSLQQWVSIQKRLRTVPGVRAIIPLRVSPSSAQVKIITSVQNAEDLNKNMNMQKFQLQRMPNGEAVLTEQ